MTTILKWTEVLFGHGDDDFPFWLLVIRINVLLFVAFSIAAAIACGLRRPARTTTRRLDWLVLAAIIAVAAALRLVAKSNLFDKGGIPYSRLLLGYKGYFGTAQLYSLFYRATSRSIDHAIALNRLLGTLTIPACYGLARSLQPRARLFPLIAAGIVALHPLHILFSASDAITICSGFLVASSYAALLFSLQSTDGGAVARTLCAIAGSLGLALSTQVRYENALLIIPALVLLVAARRRVVMVLIGFASTYFLCSWRAGSSFQHHARLYEAFLFTEHDVVFNGFLTVQFLAFGSLLVFLRRSVRLMIGVAVIWCAALALTLLGAESGHDAARVFSNWLVPIALCAAYGYSLLMTRYRNRGTILGGALLVFFATRTLVYRELLTTQYVEMAEQRAYCSLVESVPSDHVLIVPDDELMRRRVHATVETMGKYSAACPSNQHSPRLIGLTEFIDSDRGVCRAAGCYFYRGLPCEGSEIDPYTRQQCESLLRSSAVLRDQRTVVAAPFERCSIYVGGARRDRCMPTVQEHHFELYRL